MSTLISLPTDRGGLIVSYASPITLSLVDPDAAEYYTANLKIHRVDLTLIDPTAVLEVQFGRMTASSKDIGSNSHYFAGNTDSSSRLSTWNPTANPFSEVLGSYFISGAGIHEVTLAEPIECLNHHTGGDAFGVYAQRIDDVDNPTEFHLNVWYEQYH